MERRELEFLGILSYFAEAKHIVEVGVQFGDAAVHLAMTAQKNVGKYAGFDMWAQHGQAGQFSQMSSKAEVNKKLLDAGATRFELIQIDTINEKAKFEAELDRLFPNGIDFAFIDGDHSYLGIANDFAAVYPRLSARGIIAFHDTAVIDGCREFMYHLRTKYNDGTFDLIDFPFGSGNRHCGVSILSKKSYPIDSENIIIDEVCGSLNIPKVIEDQEQKQYEKDSYNTSSSVHKMIAPIEWIKDDMKVNHIGHYPNRKKYE